MRGKVIRIDKLRYLGTTRHFYESLFLALLELKKPNFSIPIINSTKKSFFVSKDYLGSKRSIFVSTDHLGSKKSFFSKDYFRSKRSIFVSTGYLGLKKSFFFVSKDYLGSKRSIFVTYEIRNNLKSKVINCIVKLNYFCSKIVLSFKTGFVGQFVFNLLFSKRGPKTGETKLYEKDSIMISLKLGFSD